MLMKPAVLLITLLTVLTFTNSAQTPHAAQLYGITQIGGPEHFGSIFHFTPETQNITIDHEFSIKVKGKAPKCDIVTGKNGKYYGTTTRGGVYDAGVIFSWD